MSEIKAKVGDLFDANVQTLTNTVNCVGVMGKGIALQFKKRFPAMFSDYADRCEQGEVKLGRPYLYRQTNDKWVLNFPTKDHWRAVSRLSDIEDGLRHLSQHYLDWGIESLAVPPLGCGYGQLDWEIVGPTLYKHLSQLEIPVELFAPHGTPPDQLQLDFLAGDRVSNKRNGSAEQTNTIPAAAIALAAVVSRISREAFHAPVGRTIFQKIAYFLTETGIPTGLEYRRGSYGPFAEDLKRMQARLINNGVLIERKTGRMFMIEPGPTYRDAREKYKNELRSWIPNIEQVADLIFRFATTNDAEVAATVHYVAKELMEKGSEPSEDEILAHVFEWKQNRRPPLSEEDVAEAIRGLGMLGWVRANPGGRVQDLAKHEFEQQMEA